MAEILKGVDTMLSFVFNQADPQAVAQRNLIDAAVKAGIRRFAPSEWASASIEHMAWYSSKELIRKYLKDLNKDKKVLEYCLFHPGLFLEYMVYPYKSSNHIEVFETPVSFHKRRVLMLEGGDDHMITLTTAQDLANVVVRAVEYDGEWPVIGGIKGTDMSVRQLISLGEKIRGGTFDVQKQKADDLKAGIVTSTWRPKVGHPSIPAHRVDALSGNFLAGFLLGVSAGTLHVSSEWNQLLPDYKFTQADEFLTKAWRGRD